MVNTRIADLEEFAFARLTALLADLEPPTGGVDLSVGDPKGAPPDWLAGILTEHAQGWRSYPPPAGTPALRHAITAWIERRFQVDLDPERHVLPVAGTKEGLHLLASVVVDATKAAARPVVLMPNPLYQVYLGGAVMAGAEPVALPATKENGFLPDLDAIPDAVLARTQLCYLCSPANPQGTVASLAYWAKALELARRHDFVLVADECYSEIYHDAPPPSALEAATASGSLDRLVVFNSLSKRSNAAGLRVGFMAGDPALIAPTLKVRRYGAATIPLPIQAAATALWQDETHVQAIRADYTAKIDRALALLDGRAGAFRPPAGFFLWLDVGDGEAAARRLFAATGSKVVPGRYLAMADARGHTPGDRYVRIALVHDQATTEAALVRALPYLAGPAATD
ncbi:MAG: aminotransferase class I/II-fold pyridoxal phosphate-dependent enzyme [Geminicoccaceae bacterium]|nr:MAG: aminotransferase class I/II-fold pyridoxal phosphate-dependent enzyme [Geminicoccaceae bacterium]